MNEFNIADRTIGRSHAPFIIAELSGNHNQSLDRAFALVDAAAKAGAHAVKLQTYTADTMTIDKSDGEFFIDDKNSLWHGHSLYELYQRAYTPWEWHADIMARCQQHGMICFSTPFDHSAVDFLEELHVPCYKIASFENTDIHLIKKVVATGKPVIISAGMATLSELELIVHTLRTNGCEQFILLKCTSAYPAKPEHANLLTIPHLSRMFDCQVGLSDHTLGIGVAVASVALGATMIEKHFTLSRAEGGVDADFSMEPAELTSLVEETDRAWQALGTVSYERSEPETASTQFKRSIYFVKDLKSGDVISKDDVRCIRPGNGLPPQYLETLLGKTVKKDIQRGTAACWELII